MRQLGEALWTQLTPEGSLPGVGSKVHFQIAQLSENFVARFAFVLYLAVLLLERVRQGLVAGVLLFLKQYNKLKITEMI